MDNKPSMIKATAIGGFAAAILSSIPIVECLNFACCSLLIGGGFLAAFLYSKDVQAAGGTFTVGNGALVGLVTAVFYAIGDAIANVIAALIFGSSAAEQFELIREQMEQQGNLPPEMLDTLDKVADFMANSGGAVLIMLAAGFALVLGAIFCTVGGLIGGAVFKKEAAPPAAPPAVPPMTPPAPPAPPAAPGSMG